MYTNEQTDRVVGVEEERVEGSSTSQGGWECSFYRVWSSGAAWPFASNLGDRKRCRRLINSDNLSSI